VTITVDGVPLEAVEGSTVMECLDRAGWLGERPRVPSLCWHPALAVSGSCRLCRVEVEGEPGLVAACTWPVREGMVVRTASERGGGARRAVLELFLARHPDECPVCDRNGDCDLQSHVFEHGPQHTRVAVAPSERERRVDLGSGLSLDRARCVLCERCVSFCADVTGGRELTFSGAGEGLAVTLADGSRVDGAYAQNLVELCPVGAITRPKQRPPERPWAIATTPGLCGGCARGCNVAVETAGDRVLRYRPRRNDAVNRSWLCDAGRLGAGDAERPDRIRRAGLRDERGRLVDVSLDEAIEEAAGRIAELVDAKGPGVLAGVASAHATNEDLFVFRRLLEAIGTDHAAVAVPTGEGDALLIRPEKAANARGAELLGFESPGGLLDRLRGGGLDALIAMGHDLLADDLLADPGALDRLDTLIVIDTAPSAMLRYAHVVIPALHLLEKHGTLTNAEGRVQRVRPAREPDFPAVSEGAAASALGELLDLGGFAARWDPPAVSREMAANIPAFAGCDLEGVGDAGRPIAAEGRRS